jgi:hypothetical protein
MTHTRYSPASLMPHLSWCTQSHDQTSIETDKWTHSCQTRNIVPGSMPPIRNVNRYCCQTANHYPTTMRIYTNRRPNQVGHPNRDPTPHTYTACLGCTYQKGITKPQNNFTRGNQFSHQMHLGKLARCLHPNQTKI